MDKNPEGSDQWHTSIIVPFPYTKFQPSKLQRHEFIVTFWTGQTCPPWRQKFLSFKPTVSQTVLACMYDNSTTKKMGPLWSLENGAICCKSPLNGRKSMGVYLKLWVPPKGNWFSRAHLIPTSHHKTSPQPSTRLALGFRWAPQTRQTGTCGAANARHHLVMGGSCPTGRRLDVEKSHDKKKNLYRRNGCCKTQKMYSAWNKPWYFCLSKK